MAYLSSMNAMRENNQRQMLLVNRAIVANNEREVLLVRRAETSFYNPRLWEFPGGKVGREQTIQDSLDREILEETGLIIE